MAPPEAHPPASAGPSTLWVKGLVRRFGPVEALCGLSFEARAGELVGLVGPDGAGKTTAIRVLAGLLEKDEGEVRVLGSDPLSGKNRERLGLMPQQYSLYRDLSVGENLRFFARLYVLPRAVYRERVERLLSITRLTRFVDRRADALSGGMYKKLALACALLHEPEVLLLDEPTNGVDPVSRRELWELLHEFVHGGMTVLVTTPYMDEAERCSRVALVHRGRVLLEGEPSALLSRFEDEVHEVLGGDRERLDAFLSTHPAVRAASPAGARLRVVVARGAGEELARALAPLGARLEPAAPDFEDLFLSRIGEAA
ncbi:MAG TPA: ABC transporter ATP-binding protein [Anaeromyxobacter sp.]|nr:ABC transporter ATP-binding protein [Anaeromyxobacter sp.]